MSSIKGYTEWQQKVLFEKQNIDRDIRNLGAFIRGEKYKKLEGKEQGLLLRQSYCMKLYSSALADRIEEFVPTGQANAYMDAQSSRIVELEKERDEARLSVSLTCELHGCASESCTAKQYHQDAQDMIAEVVSLRSKLAVCREEKKS